MVANQKVLLTGASGYLGAHVLSALLKAGYEVRATVRTQKKASQLTDKFAEYKSHLEFSIVEDVAAPHALDNAAKDVSAIVHTATPVKLEVKSNKDDLIDPAIQGTLNVLESASLSPSVKRVVITSSIVAILDILGGKDPFYVYTEKDWNPITYELGVSTPNGFVGYSASKTLAEKAAWDFVEKRKPSFDIVTLNPPWIFGPFIHNVDSLEDLNESSKLLYQFTTTTKEIQKDSDVLVDVRDVAQAHVSALSNPKASNQRYLLTAHSFDWQQVADIIHKNFPGKTNTPKGTPGVYPTHKTVNNSKARSELGQTFLSVEDTIRDSVAEFLAFKAAR